MTYAVFPEMPKGWSSRKTFAWNTTVVKSASGKRKAMTTHAYPVVTIESSLVGLTAAQTNEVFGFFCQRRGELEPFLWKDPEDYIVDNLQLAVSNGSTTEYQLLCKIGSFYLPVKDIVDGTLHVYLDGIETVNYSILDGGVLKFTATPQSGKVITVSFEYYWRVAFDDGELENEVLLIYINKIATLKLVTVR